MKHATTNADRAEQIASRKAKQTPVDRLIAASQTPSKAQFAAAATASAPKPTKEGKTTTKKGKPAVTTWVMGEFTPAGVRVVATGAHNVIEKASAALNKAAGMRVAFVVALEAVPPAMLAGAADLDDEEGEEEEEEVG